jgi:hypothetical protein
MRLGPDSVLLTAAVRFHRQLTLDQVEQAIERLEHAIKAPYPSIQHLYLESGALKQAAASAAKLPLPEPPHDGAAASASRPDDKPARPSG